MPRLEQARQDIFLDNIPNSNSDWKMGKLKKFILTTVVCDMLTEKDNYNELQIIHITHNYVLLFSGLRLREKHTVGQGT